MARDLSLAKKIEKYIESNKTFTIQELYKEFGDSYEKHTIRARVYDGKKKVIRTGKGSYILAGAEIEAVIEQANSKEEIFHIRKMNLFFDMVFLDIPYRTNGQKGGNRNLANYDLINPDEFSEIIKQVEGVLKDENSQVYFMIAGGRSSIKQSNKYIRMFEKTSLQLNASGTYTKLNKNGSVCNIGQYLLPPELILSFSADGKIKDCTEDNSYQMDFREVRPRLPHNGGYPTEKPLSLLKQIIKQSTKAGDRILDLFAGSGVSVEAALGLNRFIHAIDISEEAINNHILPRLLNFGEPMKIKSNIIV